MPRPSLSKLTPLEFHSWWHSLCQPSKPAPTSTPLYAGSMATLGASKSEALFGNMPSQENAPPSTSTAPMFAVACAFCVGAMIGILIGLVLSSAIMVLDLPPSLTPQKWSESLAKFPSASPPSLEYSHGLPFRTIRCQPPYRRRRSFDMR